MTKQSSSNFVSFQTMSLFYPLLELVEKMESMNAGTPSDVQVGIFNNGYSSAVIILSVTIFESAVTRVRFLRRELKRRPPATDYFRKLRIDRDLRIHVDEMVAVRDAIVHSHAYTTEVYWDNGGQLRARRPLRRLAGFGNKRLRRVRVKTQVTKKLKLNLVPTKVSTKDAYLVLKTLDRALEALDSVEPGYLPIRTWEFPAKGWMKTFHQKAEELARPD